MWQISAETFVEEPEDRVDVRVPGHQGDDRRPRREDWMGNGGTMVQRRQ